MIALSYKLETYFFVCNFVKKYLFKKNFPRREILTRNKSKYAGFFLLLLLKVFFLLKFLLYFLLINEKKGLNIGAYMGILMGKYRGKVDGKRIMDILKRFVK